MLKSTNAATSTTNTSNQETTNTSVDNRVAADNGAIVTKGNVTVLDGGAIGLAGEIGEQAIDAGILFGRMGNDLASESLGSTIDTLTAVIDQDRDESAKLSEQLVNMIPYIVVGVVAWGILR